MNKTLSKKVTLLGICSAVAGFLFLPPTARQASAETPVASVQQAKTINGLVKDSQGPLIGATIMEKGTNNGVVSDMDGKFTINVKPGATLVVTYVGYESKEISLGGGKSYYEITLEENSASLNEVVVIGYGTQRKEAVTGFCGLNQRRRDARSACRRHYRRDAGAHRRRADDADIIKAWRVNADSHSRHSLPQRKQRPAHCA